MKIAIFGAGGISQRAYLPILTNWPRVEIVGIFSRTQASVDRIRTKYDFIFGTTDPQDLIHKNPDAAFILTNNQTHYKFTELLLKSEIDVFVEKPLAQNSSEVQLLAELAENKSRILMVGFNRRYALLYKKAKELFNDKKIQTIIIQKNRARATHINLYNNYLDDTIHQIDLLRFFCGKVKPLKTYFEQKDGKVVGAVSVCRLKDGGLGIIITSLEAGSWQENIIIHGDNLTVEVDAFERLVVRKDDYEKVFGVDRPGRWIPEMKERGFLGEIEHFFDCVANRQQPLTNAYDALKTHKLIEQLIEVAGLKPNLPPKNGWDEISRWNT